MHKRIIIDLQDPIDYQKWHMRGSTNIPYNELLNNYRKYLTKDNTYYVYCKNGKLSKRMSTFLTYLGYSVINISN